MPGGTDMSQPIYQLVTDRILALLQQGVAPWKKPWRTRGGSALPVNLVSRRPYRGVNVFLLIAQGFSSPYWLTFKQALHAGGHVRRGERGTPIIFWRIDSQTSEASEEDDSTREHRRILLRYYTVFNVEQCEGVEVAGSEPAEVDACFDPLPACEAVYSKMPHPPELRHGGDRAFYRYSSDLVQLPRPEAFSRPEHYFSTLYHELGHACGHPSRLDRFTGEDQVGVYGSPAYAREELVAEMTAAMICGVLGIDPVKVEAISPLGEEDLIEASAAYLQHWIGVLKADSRAVVIAAARAQKAADYILGRHQEESGEQSEAA
jgi:antirestriction protein ArdC